MSTATLAPPLKLPPFMSSGASPRHHGIRRVIRGAGVLAASDKVAAPVAVCPVLALSHPEIIPNGVDRALALSITMRNALVLAALVASWPLVFHLSGVYRTRPLQTRVGVGLRLAIAMAGVVGVTAALAFVLDSSVLTPLDAVNVWWSGTALLLLTRGIRRGVVRWRGIRAPRRVLIVGAGPCGAAIHERLSSDEQGYEVAGFVDDEPGASASSQIAEHIVGSVESLESMLMRHAIDEVFVALPIKSHYRQIHEALRTCERVGVRAKYRADLYDAEVAWPTYRPADGHFVTMQVAPDDYRLVVKRAIDIAGSTLLLGLFSPVMLVAAIAIKVTSPGPVIFAQERYGLNRRRFHMFKFRTMVANAAQLQHLLEDRNEVDGPVFKISDDPRITPVGRFLRRTSIDELPQLFNVLRGDMSLVGPRPLPLRDVERFTRAGDMRRCSVHPGITCLWQVSGRNNLTFDQWMHLDLQYIDSWSLLLDVVILARTLPAVLHRTGAH